MNKYILVAVVGKTDPIRGQHDGPILHIVRWYQPERVILILTEEIGKDEQEYHHNETAIKLVMPECQVETIQTGIEKAHSYDDFVKPFLTICGQVKERYPDKKIILNITSGTPQMETAFCMIAISDQERYLPVQVASPEKSSNRSPFFNPQIDLIEEWFETDLDNEEGIATRCQIPQLLNFRRPIIQFQINSLIQNYDYAGAFQLYETNKQNFSAKTGLLLEHAKKRLNLENKEAEALAEKLEMKDVLYPIKRQDISRLVEFFNSMRIKQFRGELNDFSMRLEIITEYLGIYMLEKCMKIKLEDITKKRGRKNSYILFLSREECIQKIPGLEEFLNLQFSDSKQGEFEWGKPLNALSIVYIVSYLSEKKQYQLYKECTDEMLKWVTLSVQVRNPAAHTITAITDTTFRQFYDKGDSESLCQNIRTVLIKVFGSEASREAFDIYKQINSSILSSLEYSD